jgi:hypothetical protein
MKKIETDFAKWMGRRLNVELLQRVYEVTGQFVECRGGEPVFVGRDAIEPSLSEEQMDYICSECVDG